MNLTNTHHEILSEPAYEGYFADPFVWRHQDSYYAVGTGGREADGATSGQDSVIPLLRSRDLRRWEFVRNALIHPGGDAGDQFWAPAVAEYQGKFYLYYSTGSCDRGQAHQLRVAVADRPEGPYTDSGEPLLLPGEEIFVFDPDPFCDDDGQWYLFYDRNYLDVEGAGRAGDGIVARRMETMTRLSADVTPIVRPSADWQRGPMRDHSGRTIDWHTAEGPSVVKRGGRYYCFYSGSAWFTEGYGVDYAVSDSVLGPYHGEDDRHAPRVLRAEAGRLRGPGHNCVVVGPDGRTDWIVYHAWDAEMKKRQMYLEPLEWTAGGPRRAGLSVEADR